MWGESQILTLQLQDFTVTVETPLNHEPPTTMGFLCLVEEEWQLARPPQEMCPVSIISTRVAIAVDPY